MKLKFEFTVDTITGEFSVANMETGESQSVKVSKRASKKKDEDPNPQILLESNKICLNSAAVELMGFNVGDRIDVKYDKQLRPIIGTETSFGNKGGNMLTKSNTIACRGSKHDELAKYGTVFTISPHESQEGLFILTGDIKQPEKVIEDDINITSEVNEDLPIDLSALEEDVNVVEIDADFFKL